MPDRLMMLHMVAMRSGGVSSILQGRLFAASSIVEPSTRKTGSPSRCRQLDDSHLLSKNDRPLGMCEPLSGTRSDMVKRTSRRRSRSEEHTSELQSLMRISYAVFCLKKKNTT